MFVCYMYVMYVRFVMYVKYVCMFKKKYYKNLKLGRNSSKTFENRMKIGCQMFGEDLEIWVL